MVMTLYARDFFFKHFFLMLQKFNIEIIRLLIEHSEGLCEHNKKCTKAYDQIFLLCLKKGKNSSLF